MLATMEAAMEAARRPRLRLSRRRPPPRDGAPDGRPRPLPEPDGGSAGPWALLLRAVRADPSPDGEAPPLPAFPAQEPRRDPPRAPTPETFAAGGETFSWTPLPPPPARGRRRSYRVLRAAPGRPGAPAPPRPEPGPRGGPSAEEPRAGEAAPALRSCPLCQADFAPGLTPLEVDSHLAQCLAESTEDVVW